MNRNIMTRDEWINEVHRELNWQSVMWNMELTGKVYDDNRQWAEALAETYYDEGPNEYTPKQAIMEDLTNA